MMPGSSELRRIKRVAPRQSLQQLAFESRRKLHFDRSPLCFNRAGRFRLDEPIEVFPKLYGEGHGAARRAGDGAGEIISREKEARSSIGPDDCAVVSAAPLRPGTS